MSLASADVQLDQAVHEVTIATKAIANLIFSTVAPCLSIKSGSTHSCGVTGVLCTGGVELTTELSAAANGREAKQAFTAGLVGPLEDTVGGVGGTPPVVLGAGVYGDADLAVTLVALLTGAADL